MRALPKLPMPSPAEIRSARKQSGLTQQQCADLMGWPRLRWLRKENGHTPMEPHEWRLFLHLSGITRLPFERRSRTK